MTTLETTLFEIAGSQFSFIPVSEAEVLKSIIRITSNAVGADAISIRSKQINVFFFQLKLVAIVRRPETTTFGLSSFFEIYQLEVWLWTLPTLFFVVVTYSLSLSLDLKLFARSE